MTFQLLPLSLPPNIDQLVFLPSLVVPFLCQSQLTMESINFSVCTTSGLVVVRFPVSDVLLTGDYIDVTDPNDGLPA